jgi:hypothetical protein
MPAVTEGFTVLLSPRERKRKGDSSIMSHDKLFTGGFLALLLMSGTCDKPGPNDPPTPDPQPAFGSFVVTLVPPEGTSAGYTGVSGRVNDGPTPSPFVWKEDTAVGNFRLLSPRTPLCDPPCSGGVCVEDDSCIAYPSAIYAGIVTVNGLKKTDGTTTFSMDTAYQKNYMPIGIAYPPFSEGDIVTFSAAGGPSVSAFTLTTKGISPLVILNDSIVLEDGKSITLEWIPPTIANNTTISIIIDLSYHGTSKGKIEGECEDNGSVTVPASLLDQLKARGYFGYPKIEIIRKSIGTNSTNHVDLKIEYAVTKYVQIPGLISCNENTDCPDGQTCQYFRCQ